MAINVWRKGDPIMNRTVVFFFASLLVSCGDPQIDDSQFVDPRIIEVSLDSQYKEDNAGHVRVTIPAAYELAQIAYALAESRGDGHGRTWNKGEYYNNMMAYFEPYKNHPAVDAVNYEEWFDYWSFRQNSIAYSYSDGSLTHMGVYKTLWNGGEDKFLKVKSQLEDFARDSGFNTFYADQLEYYTALEGEFTEIIDPESMQSWLHRNFTTRYDSYLIVISPLVGGAHNFAIVRDVDYAEAIITISASNVYDKERDSDGKISEEKVLKYSRLIFTELDHNYVNPVSERFKEDIEQAIGDISTWNTSDDYRSAEATFNEYVTWAIFPLFVKSEYGEAYVEAAVADVNRVMAKRGFVKFPEFSAWMLSNAALLDGTESVESAYADMVAWFAGQ